MDTLDAAFQHPSVDLLQDVVPDVQGQVGSDPQDQAVERGVVNFAQAEAVGHDWLTVGSTVADDVRRVEELRVGDPADAAATTVGKQHLTTEHALMEPCLGHAFYVAAPSSLIT